MTEYIEREAALAALCRDCDKMVSPDEREPCRYRFTGCMEYYNIFELPAADVAPVRHGRWVDGKCDNCGEHAPYWCLATTFHESNFCPNCGAKMEVQDEV